MSTRKHLVSVIGYGLLAAASAHAGEIRVRVLDRGGKPVPEVVIAAQPQKPVNPLLAPSAKPAIMDQIDQQFVPHILVVQAGTAVNFPNSDTVSHQVYSFSPPKRFQLSLYRGHVHPPLIFPQPGVVILGCNIHDGMIGYIYVAAGPYFGQTDAQGMLLLDVPNGAYQLSVWHPRFNEPQPQIQQTVQVAGLAHDTHDTPLDIKLTRELRPELRTLRKNNGY